MCIRDRQACASFVLRAHWQGEFAVVTDSDACAALARIEHLQCITGLDHASGFLETGQLQLVLPIVLAIGREPVTAIAITRTLRQQERAGDQMQPMRTRQPGEKLQPLPAIVLYLSLIHI